MLKGLLCKLGIHDWEVIDTSSTGKEKYIIDNPNNRFPLPTFLDDTLLHKRICLRCGFIDDRILCFSLQYKYERERIKKRKEKAMELLSEKGR